VYARQANTEHPTAKREEDILIFTDNSIGHPRPPKPYNEAKDERMALWWLETLMWSRDVPPATATIAVPGGFSYIVLG
jgi:hypothetical protein